MALPHGFPAQVAAWPGTVLHVVGDLLGWNPLPPWMVTVFAAMGALAAVIGVASLRRDQRARSGVVAGDAAGGPGAAGPARRKGKRLGHVRVAAAGVADRRRGVARSGG